MTEYCMNKKSYNEPRAEVFVLESQNGLLKASSHSDPTGGIWGPDRGDDLDDPSLDYKEG